MPVTGTCLADGELDAVAREIAPEALGRITDRAELLAWLHAVLGTTPGNEHAWPSHPRVLRNARLRSLLESAFRPEQPRSWASNQRSWLSSVDIERVMTQYNDSHGKHGFRFVGVFPIDFASRTWTGTCISPAMCAVNVRELVSGGITQLGIVFNLDKHNQRGSHWVSCFAGLDPLQQDRFGVWYYDSVAQTTPPQVSEFMKSLRSQVRPLFPPSVAHRFRVHNNTVRRQFQNTECGIFSMLFIVACLTSRKSVRDICGAMGDDNLMFKLRSVLFRPPAEASGHLLKDPTNSSAAIRG